MTADQSGQYWAPGLSEEIRRLRARQKSDGRALTEWLGSLPARGKRTTMRVLVAVCRYLLQGWEARFDDPRPREGLEVLVAYVDSGVCPETASLARTGWRVKSAMNAAKWTDEHASNATPPISAAWVIGSALQIAWKEHWEAGLQCSHQVTILMDIIAEALGQYDAEDLLVAIEVELA